MISTNGSELFAGIFVAGAIGLWYFFYPSGNEFLEVKCAPGTSFDADYGCTQPNFTQGALLKLFPDKGSQKVLIKVEKRDNNWLTNELYLKNCDVISDDQWRCPISHGETERTYAVTNGTYYSTLIGGAPPDFYTTSISGWRLFLVNIGGEFRNAVNFSLTKDIKK